MYSLEAGAREALRDATIVLAFVPSRRRRWRVNQAPSGLRGIQRQTAAFSRLLPLICKSRAS